MATLYPYITPYRPATAPDARKRGQRQPRYAEWKYHFTGDEVALDIIQLDLDGQKFPKGTTVFPQLSYLFTETDCAAALTVDVGDLDTLAASAAYANGDDYAVAHVASDADRYADGVDCGAVGVDVFSGGVAAAIPYTLQEDSYLTATLATLVTPTTDGVLRIRVAYLVS